MLFSGLRSAEVLGLRVRASISAAAPASPLAGEVDWFIAAATELGYSTAVAEGMASQVLFRLLIQTGQPMARLTDADLDALSLAVRDRESGRDRRLHHYRDTLHATREVLFHLGVLSEPPPVPEGCRLHPDTDSPDTDRLTGTPAAVLPTSWPTWTVGEPPARAPR